MRVRAQPETAAGFSNFLLMVEPKLLQSLVATYGPVDGREATADALSWAWEHWERLAVVENKVGYLYRVGQTATRRNSTPHAPLASAVAGQEHLPEIDPGLLPALGHLSQQQRTVVVLVHAFGWSQTEVARVLDITPSTLREHLRRAMDRLRNELEASDAS